MTAWQRSRYRTLLVQQHTAARTCNPRRGRYCTVQRVRLAWRNHDLVFCVADGGPINPGNVLRNLHLIAKRAEVPPLNIHSMRYTHATLLLQDG